MIAPQRLLLLADGGTPTIDKRITGFKIYLMGMNNNTDYNLYKDPYLLATADMLTETFKSHEGKEVAWTVASSSGNYRTYNSAKLSISTLPTTTFEMENLYAHDVETIRAKWKTSTQIGNAVYIGNVRTINDSGTEVDVNPDKIIRSIPPPGTNRIGIFPSSDFLDVTVGDGDEIVALESFVDNLLVFKKKT